MAKKSGLFTLLTGVAVGAAAVFFSKKENQEKAKKAIKKVTTKTRTKSSKQTSKRAKTSKV